MEWNYAQPSPEIAALTDECEKRFSGRSHSCEIITREKKKGSSKTPSTDIVLGSDFGRRGKILCHMGVPAALLKKPKAFPWLTRVQLQDMFESESVTTAPWDCAIKKCETSPCKTLGKAELLTNSFFSVAGNSKR